MDMQKVVPRGAFQPPQGLLLVQSLRFAGEVAGCGFGLCVRVGIFQQGRMFGHGEILMVTEKPVSLDTGLKFLGRKMGLEPTATWATTRCSTN